MNKRKLNKTATRILNIISKAGKVSSNYFTNDRAHGELRYSSRYGFYYHIERLEKEKLVVKDKKRGRVNTYRLTEAGKRIVQLPQRLIRRQDGMSTIIMFDIPETEARKRTIFRRYLIRNGFIQAQRSVLISPNVINSELKKLIIEMNIRKYLTVISGKVDYQI